MNPVTYAEDGLVQQNECGYDMINDKRVNTTLRGSFHRTVQLHLPLFLTLPVWIRHGYSTRDIRTTLEYFASIHLWQCALLYGISISNSAIKLSFSTRESMVYGSKAIVIRKIEKAVQNIHDFTSNSHVLDTVRVDHIPPLPLHRMLKPQFHELVQLLPTQPVDLMQSIVFERSLTWRGIDIVPLWFEQDALYCIRIVPLQVFVNSQRMQHACLSNRPLDVWVSGTQFAGTEEAMFFVPEA